MRPEGLRVRCVCNLLCSTDEASKSRLNALEAIPRDLPIGLHAVCAVIETCSLLALRKVPSEMSRNSPQIFGAMSDTLDGHVLRAPVAVDSRAGRRSYQMLNLSSLLSRFKLSRLPESSRATDILTHKGSLHQARKSMPPNSTN